MVETLCFVLSDITWGNNFGAVKINDWKLLEKEVERPQRWGMWFVTNNIDLHSIEWAIRVTRPCNHLQTVAFSSPGVLPQEHSLLGPSLTQGIGRHWRVPGNTSWISLRSRSVASAYTDIVISQWTGSLVFLHGEAPSQGFHFDKTRKGNTFYWIKVPLSHGAVTGMYYE